MSGKVEDLKEKDFLAKTKKGIVLVDFWATWCHACKTVEPHLNDLTKKFNDKIKFYKINVTENPELSSRMGVMSLPNILILNNGKVKDQLIGASTKQAIESAIKKAIK
ncbi:MAG: thioredoxin [Candidatus Berkelbacteria bacterium]|nr:thioredoxin [Candidatus Berkelbacteria bacterium]